MMPSHVCSVIVRRWMIDRAHCICIWARSLGELPIKTLARHRHRPPTLCALGCCPSPMILSLVDANAAQLPPLPLCRNHGTHHCRSASSPRTPNERCPIALPPSLALCFILHPVCPFATREESPLLPLPCLPAASACLLCILPM